MTQMTRPLLVEVLWFQLFKAESRIMKVLADVYHQASLDFSRVGVDAIAERLLKRGETFGEIARSMGWPVRMLQRWWKENKSLQGKK